MNKNQLMLIGLISGIVLLGFFIYRYSNTKSEPEDLQNKIPNGSKDNVVATVFNFIFGWLRSSKSVTGDVTSLDTNKKYSAEYPIIFVHGWNGNLDTFEEMQDKLDEDGIAEDKGSIYSYSTKEICKGGWNKAVSVNFEYYEGDEGNSIDIYAKRLSEVVKLVKDCSKTDKVNIISHSMGGLVSRNFIQNYDGNNDVKSLVMIGTPNKGIGAIQEFCRNLVYNINAVDCEEMEIGSTFIDSLNNNYDFSKINYLIISGTGCQTETNVCINRTRQLTTSGMCGEYVLGNGDGVVLLTSSSLGGENKNQFIVKVKSNGECYKPSFHSNLVKPSKYLEVYNWAVEFLELK